MTIVSMLKQDRLVDPHSSLIFFSNTVQNGPRDHQIEVRSDHPGVSNTTGPWVGHFVVDLSHQTFKAVHAYAVVRQVLDMYERNLQSPPPKRIVISFPPIPPLPPIPIPKDPIPYPAPFPRAPIPKGPGPDPAPSIAEAEWMPVADEDEEALNLTRPLARFAWQWGSDRLQVFDDHPTIIMKNAYYSRNERALRFFHYPDNDDSNHTVFTVESYDIVAHETGHAVLDALKPGWISGPVGAPQPYFPPLQTSALHEAFGDLSALFGLLHQCDIVDQVLVASRGDLSNDTFLHHIGEEFGETVSDTDSLRNIDNDLTMRTAGNRAHDVSLVFSGAIFRILVQVFNVAKTSRNRLYSPQDILSQVSRELKELFLWAIFRSPETEPTFRDVANQFLTLTSWPYSHFAWHSIVRDEFVRREILPATIRLSAEVQEPVKNLPAKESDFRGTCLTVNVIGRSAEVQRLEFEACKRRFQEHQQAFETQERAFSSLVAQAAPMAQTPQQQSASAESPRSVSRSGSRVVVDMMKSKFEGNK